MRVSRKTKDKLDKFIFDLINIRNELCDNIDVDYKTPQNLKHHLNLPKFPKPPEPRIVYEGATKKQEFNKRLEKVYKVISSHVKAVDKKNKFINKIQKYLIDLNNEYYQRGNK